MNIEGGDTQGDTIVCGACASRIRAWIEIGATGTGTDRRLISAVPMMIVVVVSSSSSS